VDIKIKMKKTNLLNYPKLLKILSYLYIEDEKIITDIAKNNEIRYSYISKQIKLLKKLGLISNEVKGRKNFINLTEKGEEVGKRVNEIEGLLK